MKMARTQFGDIEVEAGSRLARRDMKRIAWFVGKVGGTGLYRVEHPLHADAKKYGFSLSPGHNVSFEIEIARYGCEWTDEENIWFAATIMKAVQAAGHATAFWSDPNDGWHRAEAYRDDGEDLHLLAWCCAETEVMAAAGLALWARRELRRKR